MKKFTSFLFEIAIVSSIASTASAASQTFDGFWALVGLQALKDTSSSNVTYHYENKDANSLNPPGIVKDGTYEAKGEESKAMPSWGFLYVKSSKRLIWGFSAVLNFHDTKKIKNEKFDFYAHSSFWDGPRGYQMNTLLFPKNEFRISVEPGISLGDKAMIYARLSYYQMNAFVSTETKATSGLINPVYTEVATDESFVGTGVGIGLRWKWSSTSFIDASFDNVSYQAKKIAASNMTSTGDEITLTQSQELTPRWSVYGLTLGFQF